MSGATKDRGIARLVSAAIAFALRRRLVRAFLHYSEHRGPALADGVTYRALFSVFAGVLLGFSLVALWLGGDPVAMQALVDSLDAMLPGLTDVVDPRSVQANVGFTLVGIFSLIGLVGAAVGAVGSLRTALRVLADEVHDETFFLWTLVRNALVALLFGVLIGAAAVLTVAGATGIDALASLRGVPVDREAVSWLSRGVGIVVVFAIDTLAVALVFRLLSGVRAPARALWGGALLGGLGLIVLQELSGLFVRGAAANPLLASFAALVALLLWINLSVQVILVAGSWTIVATAEDRDRVRERFGASTFAQRRLRQAENRVRVATRELRAAQAAEERERTGGRPEAPETSEGIPASGA